MENKKRITEDIRKKLRAPFPKEALSEIESKPYLTAIKAMYIIERLNDVFGIGRWNLTHEVIKEQSGQVLIKGQLELLDYYCVIPEQYGSHKIEGKGVELADGYKSAITDCLTKSASYLEIGIDVFKGKIKFEAKSKINDDLDPDGNEKKWLNEKDIKIAVKRAILKGIEIQEMRDWFKISNHVYDKLKIEFENALKV